MLMVMLQHLHIYIVCVCVLVCVLVCVTALFFVTTSPGHLHCRRNSTPVTTPLLAEPTWVTAEEMPPSFANYSWELYPKHDKVSECARWLRSQ